MADVVDLYTGLPKTAADNTSFTQAKGTAPSSSNTSTTGSSSTSGNSSSTTSQYSLNTTPEILDALNKFIAQLSKGGTVEQQDISAERQQQIVNDIQQQKNYTPEKAQATAEGLSSYFARVLSEQALPGILRAAEGSGTSRGTTRALLTQQAIQRETEVAAKTGADLSTAYGGLSNQLAGILENLTKNDPNSVANQLVQAINASKSIVTQGSSTQVGNQTQTGTQSQNAVTQKSGELTADVKQFQQPNNGTGNLLTPSKDTFTAGTDPGYTITNQSTTDPLNPIYDMLGKMTNQEFTSEYAF